MAAEPGQDENFPSLGRPESAKVKRPRLALPRAKSAQKRSADNMAGERSGPSQPEVIDLEGDTLPSWSWVVTGTVGAGLLP
eukprot:11316515-Alexandrium_andersonii.AAC.1